MSKDEINMLLKQIKIMYPRFDSVEKDGMKYGIIPEVTDSWFQRIGWMEYDRAIRILDRHMESEEGNRVPTIALWMNNGKAMRRGSGDITATYERKTGKIIWKPEENGHVYERNAIWNSRRGCFEDDDGYDWVFAGE